MADTYTSRLKLTLQVNGSNSATWGDITDENMELIDDAISGAAAVVYSSDANKTLTSNDGATDEARCAILLVTSGVSLTATRDLIVPTASKSWWVYNNTTGSQSIRVKTSAGTGITIPNGKRQAVYCDGTNVVDSINNLPSGATIGGGAVYSAGGTDVAVADGGTGASTAADARTNLGLGTIATQASSNVSITGGSITGITDLAVADGGTGASTAANARTNLGLGTIAPQDASNVSITGGAITGITDLAVADGGTGASSASAARTNLGVVIGTDVQAYSAKLANLVASSGVSGTITVSTSSPSGGSDGDIWLTREA